MRPQYSGYSMRESEGLTAAEVAERVARGQVNDVPSAPTRTIGQIVRSNLVTRFNLLLGSLLAVILVVGPLQDALFGLVIVANTVVGIVQELRAKRTLDRLEVVNAPRARVVRDGRVAELALGQVVLDDVLEAAARGPAVGAGGGAGAWWGGAGGGGGGPPGGRGGGRGGGAGGGRRGGRGVIPPGQAGAGGPP